MREETILTKHPRGKSGKNISKEKYDAVAAAIRAALAERPLTHNELMSRVADALHGKFEGHVSWYAETVKLDLEARDAIERTATKPERYRLK